MYLLIKRLVKLCQGSSNVLCYIKDVISNVMDVRWTLRQRCVTTGYKHPHSFSLVIKKSEGMNEACHFSNLRSEKKPKICKHFEGHA